MKIFRFKPYICCSGTGPAVAEFNNYKDEIEKAHGKVIRMLKVRHFFGCVISILYTIEE